ncbi:hypothetical protein EZH22_27805 [Xanthobacter dioxanivorans]|uniref:Uncharacterized protein n=1 Tax=Xanthobacter dioxanivorans TaxID=2528964 RepID=A0A974SIQ0_9HYPH|nr:hypothetical protein [Xanthobacter dioxanivorans]QRG06667.1 hypothetical protein EZH22_27805 [Xanthobacter dioxanivorans]
MADDTNSGSDDITPANDNQGPEDGPEREAPEQVDRVAIRLARIGRRMAREDFERLTAANDNRPRTADSADDEADSD